MQVLGLLGDETAGLIIILQQLWTLRLRVGGKVLILELRGLSVLLLEIILALKLIQSLLHVFRLVLSHLLAWLLLLRILMPFESLSSIILKSALVQ